MSKQDRGSEKITYSITMQVGAQLTKMDAKGTNVSQATDGYLVVQDGEREVLRVKSERVVAVRSTL